MELVEKFVTYSFCTRDRVSAIAREGLGDSFELQLRYMLAKFVFVSLEYVGWTGLNAYELHKKAEPYKFAGVLPSVLLFRLQASACESILCPCRGGRGAGGG